MTKVRTPHTNIVRRSGASATKYRGDQNQCMYYGLLGISLYGDCEKSELHCVLRLARSTVNTPVLFTLYTQQTLVAAWIVGSMF